MAYMKKFVIYISSCIILILLFSMFYIRNMQVPKDALRKAVKHNQILNEKYILCQRARVTGFDWLVIQDEYGNKTNEFCNIIGANPFMEYNFNYEFVMADNTYVFYLTDVDIVFSEESAKTAKLYQVYDWDIMYPVMRESIKGAFCSRKYIQERDID